jgi:hypothetical protein
MAKLNPGIRPHLPELAELVARLLREPPRRASAYATLGEALGVTASLIEQYTLKEKHARREASGGGGEFGPEGSA